MKYGSGMRERKKQRGEKLSGRNRCKETVQGFKAADKSLKKVVAKAKAEAYNDLYDSLADVKEGQRKAIRIAELTNRVPEDVCVGKQIIDRNGVVLNEDNEIGERD